MILKMEIFSRSLSVKNLRVDGPCKTALFFVSLLFILARTTVSLAESNPSKLKLLSLNLWHGLDAKGLINFGRLETLQENESRFKRTIDLLQKENFDLLFLQEVNPIRSRSSQLAEVLYLDEVHQSDNCGIKVFGFGPPFNFHSGITILAKKSLQLKKLTSVKLSGSSFGSCGDWFSFQLSEFRYALFASIEWNQEKLLLINTHLHHEVGNEFPDSPQEEGMLSSDEKSFFTDFKNKSSRRRKEEVDQVLKSLSELSASTKYASIILAGDFNTKPSSPALAKVRENFPNYFPFNPLNQVSWDPEKNPLAKTATGLKPSDPYFQNSPALRHLWETYHLSPREIDLVFLKGRGSLKDQGFFPEKSAAVSDHYGIKGELLLK